jgi:VWFA-related protein
MKDAIPMPGRIPYPALLTLAAALALALVAPPSARTQVESNLPGAGFGPEDASPVTPTLHVYSRETIVDVLVTDDKGQPVRGLTHSDFAISEDGHPQPISSFAENSRTAPVASASALPPNTYSNAHALPASGPVQILYFDLPYGTSYPQGTDPIADWFQGNPFVRSKKYIADYLRTMPARTQVAVFAFRADYGLRLLQGFTTDGQRAAAAVDNLVVLSAGPAPIADPIAAADQIAAYVAGIHGRKDLIWIGSPLPIMRDGGLSWSVGAPPDMIYVHRLMDTYDIFTREQIAIYPFDPQGVPPPGPRGEPRALGFGNLRNEDIATETGGAAIYNNNDFKGAVARIVDDTSHFYTLSYIPPRPTDDGHFHAISIAVDRPGLHLVYRGGYNAEQPVPPDSVLKVHMNQATMGLGSLPSTQLLFDVQLLPNPAQPVTDSSPRRPLSTSGKTPSPYGLLFQLSQDQITFAAAPDGTRNAALEFDAAAYDPTGKLVAVNSQTLKLPLSPAEYQDFIQTPFRFLLFFLFFPYLV